MGWRRDAVVVHDPAGTLAAMGMLKNEGADVLDADLYVSPISPDADSAARCSTGSRRKGSPAAVPRCTLSRSAGTGRPPAGRRPRLRAGPALLPDADRPRRASAGTAVARRLHGRRLPARGRGDPPRVLEEAFADHWGHEDRDLEWWHEHIFGVERGIRRSCISSGIGGEAVAAEINAHRFGMGWIGSVGTRTPWRGRGLGRALLLSAFGELYRRGERRIGLGRGRRQRDRRHPPLRERRHARRVAGRRVREARR